MNKFRQLILLTPGFPDDEKDTSCISTLQDFVLGWQSAFPDLKIDIIAFQYPHESKKYQWHKLSVYAAGGKDKGGVHRLYTWLKVFLYLLRMQKNKQAIVLSYFLTEAAIIGWLFSKVSGMQHVAIAAGQDVTKENKYLPWLAAVNTSIAVFNEKMKETLYASSRIKASAVIPMGVSHVILPGPLASHRNIDVLFAGSLIPVKQPALAIQIISQLQHEFSALHAEIAGDGSERSHVLQLINELQLTGNISFNGQLKREEVFAKMKHAKILLHTSLFEGQSAVITEALQAGMYVVCFDVGRITDHPKVHVCRSRDEMLHAMVTILHNPQSDFSPVNLPAMSSTVIEYSKLFNQLLSAR